MRAQLHYCFHVFINTKCTHFNMSISITACWPWTILIYINIYYKILFNCLSVFLVQIGQKSITWQKVFCATTGDDVSRSLLDWADRSLFTRGRPIDSVLFTRAESASACCMCSCAFLTCWAKINGAERLIRVKAGRKMHLSALQGKTSLLQIVIHLFLLLFHCVYILFCWPFQLNLSLKYDIVCNSILTLLSE